MTLSSNQRQMLSRILEAKGCAYDEFMAGFGTDDFPSWKFDELCNWVNDEFMMQGLDASGEPNETGLELEELLDAVNRQRLIA